MEIHGMPLDDAHTFEAQFGDGNEWLRSAGRWDTMGEAAEAACKWLRVCSENSVYASVRVIPVRELAIDAAVKPV